MNKELKDLKTFIRCLQKRANEYMSRNSGDMFCDEREYAYGEGIQYTIDKLIPKINELIDKSTKE